MQKTVKSLLNTLLYRHQLGFEIFDLLAILVDFGLEKHELRWARLVEKTPVYKSPTPYHPAPVYKSPPPPTPVYKSPPPPKEPYYPPHTPVYKSPSPPVKPYHPTPVYKSPPPPTPVYKSPPPPTPVSSLRSPTTSEAIPSCTSIQVSDPPPPVKPYHPAPVYKSPIPHHQ
uniref:Extensin n=1 Tax=Solanum tuberosum TaxID=4113 RepID=M0ZJI8_SOLTU